ncbi:MAG: ABC transporter permease [Butyrivibrio sp.]
MKKRKSLKALRKDFFAELFKTYNKFLSLLFIVALGVAFYAGIRSTEPDMEISADKIYDDSNYMDIKIQSATGINEELLDKIENTEGIKDVEGSYTYDAMAVLENEKTAVRIMSYSSMINIPNITEGRAVENPGECIVDIQYMDKQGYKIGDTLKIEAGTDTDISYILQSSRYTIVGSFTSPLYLKNDRGTCSIGDGKISGVIYIDKSEYLLPVYTEAYATVEKAAELLCFDEEYSELIKPVSEAVEETEQGLYVLDRSSMQQYVEYKMDCERIGKIGEIVPIIFFAVAALVSLTTMIRMVEEQRTQIGTLKALGYGNFTISMKYIMYGFLATVLGSIIGALVGSKLIPTVIINAYKIIYHNLTIIEVPLNIVYILTAFAMAFVSVIGATVAACYKTLAAPAAELMRPAAPKNGKRILLERITFIWNRMSFIWKSTVRNLMRYKKKMIMTIFGISGCTALLLIGFGIKDSINAIVDTQYGELHTYDEELTLESGISPEDTEKVRKELIAMEEVDGAFGIYQGGVSFTTEDNSKEGYIYVPESDTEMEAYIKLRDYETGKKLTLTDDEAVISAKLAKVMNLSVGDELTIKLYSGDEAVVRIGGITENYVYHYVYMNNEAYEKYFGSVVHPAQIFVKIKDDYNSNDISEKFLTVDGIGAANSVTRLRSTFSEMLKGLDIIIVVIVAAAGGLAFVVLYNLNTINIGERIRELATLKVLGFYDNEVSSYVFRENIILTLMGIICGYFLGNGLHKIVINIVEPDFIMFGRAVAPLSYVYATLITLFFAAVINFTMHFKLKKIDMSSSMKSVE